MLGHPNRGTTEIESIDVDILKTNDKAWVRCKTT